MLIPTALEIDELMKKVECGNVITVATIRDYLTKKYKVDFTCPLTTGIFVWIDVRSPQAFSFGLLREQQKKISPKEKRTSLHTGAHLKQTEA